MMFIFPFLVTEISPEELADAFSCRLTETLTLPLLEVSISAVSAITFCAFNVHEDDASNAAFLVFPEILMSPEEFTSELRFTAQI